MNDNGYWSRSLRAKITRRRTLALSGGAVLAASFLAACGGGKNESGGSTGSSGLVTQPVDTTKQAKVGGVFKGELGAEPQSFDPMFTSLSSATRNIRMYSRFLEFTPGITKPAGGEVEGDLAQAWEFTPDKLQLTIKLVPNAHFDPRPPTNGRVLDSQDIMWSWDRFRAQGTLRADYVNSLNPGAPIVSMTAPDARTIVLKLNEPQAGIITQLTASSGGNFLVMPREAEGGYDPRNESHSSGPYLLQEHKPSVGSVYKRNPGHHKAYPYMETLELPIISEYAAALAQFRVGGIHQLTSSVVRAEDVIPTKKDVPELMVLPGEYPSSAAVPVAMFGWENGPKSPFRDVRLRQAFSMSMDRDLYLDTIFNISKFAAEGLNAQTRWYTAVAGAEEGWWLDPKSKEFGPNASYYEHNIAEAKKLVAAAGYANGIDVDAFYVTTGEYGRDFNRLIEIATGMVVDAGIRLKTNPVGFTTDWRPKYADVKGNHPGVSFRLLTGPPDSGDKLYSWYNSKGTLYQGFSPDGSSSFAGDPTMDDLTLKLRREFDLKARWALAYEVQRLNAKQQYWAFLAGGASGFRMAWPCVQNAGVYRGGRDELVYEWLDETKPPFKKA